MAHLERWAKKMNRALSIITLAFFLLGCRSTPRQVEKRFPSPEEMTSAEQKVTKFLSTEHTRARVEEGLRKLGAQFRPAAAANQIVAVLPIDGYQDNTSTGVCIYLSFDDAGRLTESKVEALALIP